MPLKTTASRFVCLLQRVLEEVVGTRAISYSDEDPSPTQRGIFGQADKVSFIKKAKARREEGCGRRVAITCPFYQVETRHLSINASKTTRISPATADQSKTVDVRLFAQASGVVCPIIVCPCGNFARSAAATRRSLLLVLENN